MPLPALLPLLGILGLGAGAVLGPKLGAMAEDTMARRRAQRFQGLDPGMLGGLLGRGEDPEPFNPDLYTEYSTGRAGPVDPNISPFVYNAELIRSGLLAPETLTDTHGLANIQGGYGLAQQGMSDASAWDRAVLGETGATERARMGDAAAWNRAVLGEGGATERTRIGEGGALWRQQESDRAAMDRLVYETQNRPVEPMLDFSDPQALADYTNRYDSQQMAMNAGEDALDFMDQYTGLAEVTPGTDAYARRAEIEQRLKVSALPVMAQLFEAGAMSDEEQKFFMQLSGGDFASLYGDARGRATFEALLDKIEDVQRRQYQGAGASGVAYLLDPPARRRQRDDRPRTTTSPITRSYVDPRQ